MTQEWHDVLFLHWPVSPEDLRNYIPSELELDLYSNCAWIGLVSFRIKGNRPRFIPPIPGVSSFLQLNVRTYVTYKGMSGVHFFSLDVNNPFVVKMTTVGNFLPFRQGEISLKRSNNTWRFNSCFQQPGMFSETLLCTFEPMSNSIKSNPFERWLTERYHLWTITKEHLVRVDISHSPWVLHGVDVTIDENTMAPFIKCNNPMNPPTAHFSKMKKAVFFPPVLEKTK
ncbi:YqjF family protein [Psychrobacillus vulpis]|nr:DUF2071 domain-containing protein [Psychrobacillus vulpis]